VGQGKIPSTLAGRSAAPEPEKPAAPSGEPIEEEAAPAWPGEAEEASFLSGERASSAAGAVATGSPAPAVDTAEVADTGQPPPLEELIQRIPSEIREAMEELFRAKFTRVTRVRVSEKKAGPA
jgi:hypothetical protein